MGKAIQPRDLQAAAITLRSGRYLLVSFERCRKSLLTPSEEEVALAMLAGRSNAEIAGIRGTSPRTVANQIAGIFQKLGVRSRTELAARWTASLCAPEG
jgi:DNA-binding CsgD family transcriptional regulator